MLLINEIDGHYLLTVGFAKTNIRDPQHTLEQLRSVDNRVVVQLVKADLVAGPEHLKFAARNALYSFTGKRRRSKSLAMELLLYLSCQRQIAKAVNFLGVDPNDSRIALVALSDSKDAIRQVARQAESMIKGEEDDTQIEIGSKQKMTKLQDSYRVTRKEMKAARLEGETDSSVLERLIVERSALLDLED